jgi:hypothetical protein
MYFLRKYHVLLMALLPKALDTMSDDRLHHPSFAARAINKEGIRLQILLST